MSPTYESLVVEARKLSPQEQSRLAHALLCPEEGAVSEEEVEAAWELECARRWEQIQRGDAVLVSLEEVLAEVRAVRRR
jgi:hypothetical protein